MAAQASPNEIDNLSLVVGDLVQIWLGYANLCHDDTMFSIMVTLTRDDRFVVISEPCVSVGLNGSRCVQVMSSYGTGFIELALLERCV